MAKPGGNRIFLGLLFVLLLAACAWYAWWFYNNFEEYTEQVRVDISPQAKRNPYLAAERFLQHVGMKAKSLSGRDIFNHPLTDNDTILLASNSRFFLERNHDHLLEWVNDGGNLILVPGWTVDDEEDKGYTLLKQFGIELHSSWEDGADESSGNSADSCNVPPEKANSNEGGNEGGTSATDTTDTADDAEAPIADGAKPEFDLSKAKPDTVVFTTKQPGDYLADFQSDRYLKADMEKADVVIGSDEHPHLMQFPVGNGRLTVLSDMKLFNTRHIGEQDHAYLLRKLVQGSGTVWLFYSADMPSLFSLLMSKAPYLVLLLGIALLLAVWWLLGNSGPKLLPQFDVRRNLLEHLYASAQYSWRVDKARQLFSDNRSAVEQAWRRRHPQLNSLSEEQRCDWIAEQSGLATNAIRRTLYGDISVEQDFIRASSILQRLATEVGRYSRKTSDQ